MAEPGEPVVQRTGDFVEVVLAGDIDLAVKSDLLEAYDSALRLAEVPHLLIDVTAVTFMDSTGLSTLVQAWTRARARGGTIAVVGASARILRLLEITRLDSVIPVLSEAPMRSVGSPAPHASSNL